MLSACDLVPMVTAYLESCFALQTSPRVEELALFLGVSRATLHRIVRATLDTTPSALLKAAQVAFAKELITSTSDSLTTIAYQAGCGTRATFFRLFREHEGITPGQLRATK